MIVAYYVYDDMTYVYDCCVLCMIRRMYMIVAKALPYPSLFAKSADAKNKMCVLCILYFLTRQECDIKSRIKYAQAQEIG